jgi:hypothetical protein
MLQPRRTIGVFLYILFGPLVWAGYLTVTYGTQSSLCAFDIGEWPAGANPLVSSLMIAATLMGIAALAVAVWQPHAIHRWLVPGKPPVDISFLTWVMRALSVLSILAILYAGVASVVLPACAQLR